MAAVINSVEPGLEAQPPCPGFLPLDSRPMKYGLGGPGVDSGHFCFSIGLPALLMLQKERWVKLLC